MKYRLKADLGSSSSTLIRCTIVLSGDGTFEHLGREWILALNPYPKASFTRHGKVSVPWPKMG